MAAFADRYEILDKEMGRGAWSVVKRVALIPPYVPLRPGGEASSSRSTQGPSAASPSSSALLPSYTPDSRFVVKIIDKKYLLSLTKGDEERAMADVKREIDILRTLPAHPNIASFVESYETAAEYLLVFEEVTGGDLCEVILQLSGKIEQEAARRYLFELIQAVVACHVNDVAHRDVKPENALVGSDGSIKLTDFGLAKRAKNGPPPQLGDDGSAATANGTAAAPAPGTATATGPSSPVGGASNPLAWLAQRTCVCSDIIGTARYGAPEMFAAKFAKSTYDGFLADTWSVGVVGYILLTGTFPFSAGAKATEKETYKVIIDTEPAYPSALPQPAAQLLRRLLEKDPARRIRLHQALDCPWFDCFYADMAGSAPSPSATTTLAKVYDTAHYCRAGAFPSGASPASALEDAVASASAATPPSVLLDLLQRQRREIVALQRQIRSLRWEALVAARPPGAASSSAGGGGLKSGSGTARLIGAGGSSSARPGSAIGGVRSGSAGRGPLQSPLPSPARGPGASPGSSAVLRNRSPLPGPGAARNDSGGNGVARRSGTPTSAPLSTPGGGVGGARGASPLARSSPAIRRGTPVRGPPGSATPTGAGGSLAPPSRAAPAASLRSGTPTKKPAAAAALGASTGRSGTPTSRPGTPTGASAGAGGARPSTPTRGAAASTGIRGITSPKASPAASSPAAGASPSGSGGGAVPSCAATRANDFAQGDHVIYRGSRALVHFSGTTSFGPGVWLGIELLEGKEGTNDGTSHVDKKRYFTCPKGAGVFVRPAQVQRV